MKKQGKCILVVDDEMDMRTFLATFLETNGYQPIVAENGSVALSRARTKRPQLIIMDVMMPGEGGIHLYRKLKADSELQNIPVIMLSAITKRTFFDAQNILDSHVGWSVPEPEAYMEKPPEPEELLQLTRRLLGDTG